MKIIWTSHEVGNIEAVKAVDMVSWHKTVRSSECASGSTILDQSSEADASVKELSSSHSFVL